VLHSGGIPDEITDLTIPPDMITPSSFVAQWSEPSSDLVCGTVQYIVTVYNGGRVISNDTIEGTTFTATGLCSDALYNVNVSAINIAGNAIPATIKIVTSPTGKLINSCFNILNMYVPIHSTQLYLQYVCIGSINYISYE